MSTHRFLAKLPRDTEKCLNLSGAIPRRRYTHKLTRPTIEAPVEVAAPIPFNLILSGIPIYGK
jgi:hypothetical protein